MKETEIICSISEVVYESKPGITYPTFATRHSDDDLLNDLPCISSLKIVSKPLCDGKTILEAITDVDCDCNHPTQTITYELATQAMENFLAAVNQKRCFIWFISTPHHEARLLVNSDTHRVIEKTLEDRILH
jgi:hypothetical protein